MMKRSICQFFLVSGLFWPVVWGQTYTISTLSGNGQAGYTGDGDIPANAQYSQPTSLAWAAGGLYITDTNNQRIRLISGGMVSTIAGDGSAGELGDGGPATSAEINNAAEVALDSAGNFYIADAANDNIRKVTASTGNISLYAGLTVLGYSGDGNLATAANLNIPTGVAIDPAGNVWIADTGNNVIRMVTASTGDIATVIGAQFATTNVLSHPTSLVFDKFGVLYISDTDNHRVVKYLANVLTLVAGSGENGYSGDGGPATAAELSNPTGLAFDAAGNLYIADSTNNVIREVSNGVITTVAGNGTPGYTGDGGPAQRASLFVPEGVVFDNAGNMYIGDSQNNVIRMLTPVFPAISNGGVVNAASFVGPISPGSLASVFVANLPYVTATSTAPLSTSFEGVSVSVNGTLAPVLGVYGRAGQVNFQVPWETAVGNASVTVSVNGGASNAVTVPVVAAAPGLFCVGSTAAVQNAPAYSLNSVNNPIAAGGTIVAYLTGGGPVSPAVADGAPAPLTAGSYTYLMSDATATIGGQNAPVAFAGMAPGFVSLVQVNVQVPAGLAKGSYPLALSIDGGTALTSSACPAVVNVK